MTLHPLTAPLEHACLAAWPALEEHALDGWRVRFSAGFTRRANSVNALGGGELAVHERVARCEALYAERGQPCVFKITPLVQPAGLDGLLGEAGYRREGETRVQVLAALPGDPEPARCALGAAQGADWLAAFTAMDETPARHRPTLRAILGRIAAPHVGAVLHGADGPVACGRAVAGEGQVGLFDIVTAPAHRGRGHARRLIAHLLAWGRAQGAQRAYLQVEADNVPALRLYERLGFQDVYRYWYRVRP